MQTLYFGTLQGMVKAKHLPDEGVDPEGRPKWALIGPNGEVEDRVWARLSDLEVVISETFNIEKVRFRPTGG